MRVTAITPNYPPGSRVGAWLATHRFLSHLAARGHEVTAFAELNWVREYDLDGVHVETGLRGRSRALDLACASDVVISHCGDLGLGVEAARRAGVPHVRMAHGLGVDTIGADLVVFNSESLREAIDYDGPTIVCRPPVAAAEHRCTPGESVTIVNCSEAKGIKTAWRCAEQLPTVPFLGVLGGYGHQVEPRSANFEVIEPVWDMREVWSRTRVLLMPSAEETYGLVAIEAACAGIPTIAHPTPGLTESLGSAATFADRDDTDAWVDAIERLTDPRAWTEASERALALAAERDPAPDLDRFADAVEQLAPVAA
jgi:glycosyltransferase involved in cell wall biosynthesis